MYWSTFRAERILDGCTSTSRKTFWDGATMIRNCRRANVCTRKCGFLEESPTGSGNPFPRHPSIIYAQPSEKISPHLGGIHASAKSSHRKMSYLLWLIIIFGEAYLLALDTHYPPLPNSIGRLVFQIFRHIIFVNNRRSSRLMKVAAKTHRGNFARRLFDKYRMKLVLRWQRRAVFNKRLVTAGRNRARRAHVQ